MLWQLRDGQVGPLVELPTGFHVIRLVKRTHAGVLPFNDEKVQKQIRDKLRGSGFNPAGTGPDALRARVAEEVAMWKEVIARTGLKAE